MIPVGRLAPVNQWDQTMVEDLLNGVDVQWHSGYPSQTEGAILLIPARYWAGHETEVSMAVSRYRWLLCFLTSDEEQLFDASKLTHPNMRLWIQTPRQGRTYPEGSRFIGVGYSPHVKLLPTETVEKTLNVFLSCQDTHQRRHDCFLHLKGLRASRVHPTPGFTQGMDPAEYMRCMSKAKVAPAPSGAVSPDSFRLFEALESHCIPIADAVSPVDGPTNYWERLFPDAPFPIVEDWESIDFDWLLADWVEDANIITAWWMRQKRTYAHWLVEDLEALGAV